MAQRLLQSKCKSMSLNPTSRTTPMNKRKFLKLFAFMTCLTIACAPPLLSAESSGPIKVGILHSLSGTMAISETSLKDVALMTIEEINKSGGVMGRQLDPVVVDPASKWPLFAEK